MKVLIADDHPVVRQGLKAILQAEPDMTVVGEARDSQEAVDLARSLEWDVAVIDYSMPGMSGAELVEAIKREKPYLPVLVLSMHAEGLHGIRAMKAGASGYLNKESASEELARAIRKVARGGKYVSAALAEKLAEHLTGTREKSLHEKLSEREYHVMCLLVEGKLINEIGEQLSVSPSTVSTYRARILQKLNLSSNADLIRYALKDEPSP
jgi:two-component system, NarL family, invasion response regulator UvrY